MPMEQPPGLEGFPRQLALAETAQWDSDRGDFLRVLGLGNWPSALSSESGP